MLASEVAKLLTFVGSVEGREAATQQQVAAWLTLLEPVDYEVAARAAREHYLNESRRLWPADILNWRDVHDVAEVESFATVGLRVSEQRWTNAQVLPAEEVENLGAAEARGDGEGYARRLSILYGLQERPKEVGA